MRVAHAVVGSVAVHAVALAVVGGIVLTRGATPPPLAAIEEPPIEVTLIEPAPGGEASGAQAIGEPAAAPGVARIVAHGGHAIVGGARAGGGTTETLGTAATPAPAGHDRMRMRGPELHPAELSFDPDKHPLPPPIAISGRLHDAGRNLVIPDLVTTVTVDPDGGAHFHDKPDAEIHLVLPIMSRAQLGTMLRKWYEDPYAQTRVGRTQDLSPVDQAVEGTWNSGLSTTPDQQKSGATVPIVGGSFDITAWAMRKAHVGDPYQARKLALLDATRAERAERGGVYRAQQLARSAEIMRGNLEQLWRATADAAQRREALFQLWDECVEGEGTQADAGARARAQVVGWIRARLPAGAPDAFTVAEIAALDAKRASHQHFCPYE